MFLFRVKERTIKDIAHPSTKRTHFNINARLLSHLILVSLHLIIKARLSKKRREQKLSVEKISLQQISYRSKNEHHSLKESSFFSERKTRLKAFVAKKEH